MATGGEKLRFGPACLCCAPPTAWWDPEEAAAASADGPRREAPKLLNTFTKTKVPFVPLNGNRVGWYICGPTVYGGAINRFFFFFLPNGLVLFFFLSSKIHSLAFSDATDATRRVCGCGCVECGHSLLLSSLRFSPLLVACVRERVLNREGGREEKRGGVPCRSTARTWATRATTSTSTCCAA